MIQHHRVFLLHELPENTNITTFSCTDKRIDIIGFAFFPDNGASGKS